jgi:hypothetical protein
MPKHNFKPWVWAAAVAVVVALVGYPFYFNWWDHKNCQDSGGNWNEAAGKCVEPPHADIPGTEGSPQFESDNVDTAKSDDGQGGARPRE